MKFASCQRLCRLAVVLCLTTGLCHLTSLARADLDEAREYLAKAQEHLAANDTLVVDNLLRLAEAGLEDAPAEQQAPLRAEIDALRKQFESDASARRARLIVQRLDRLFEEAELTLGAPRAGGSATLHRIDQLLAEPDSGQALGATHVEKYRRRLALFRRAHERKLQDRGAALDESPTVELEAEDPRTEDASSAPESRSGGRSAAGEAAPNPPRSSPQTPQATGTPEKGRTPPLPPAASDSETGDSRQPVQFILFGGTLSNTSLFSRFWKLCLILSAGFIGLVKSGFQPIRRVPRLATLSEYVAKVPPPMWGLLMGVIGFWWMIDGWIVYGLAVSTAMLSLGLYLGIDVIERVGLLGAPAAAAIRKYGRLIALAAVAVAVAHLFLGNSWVVV